MSAILRIGRMIKTIKGTEKCSVKINWRFSAIFTS